MPITQRHKKRLPLGKDVVCRLGSLVCYRVINMGTKRSFIEVIHDEGYGHDLVRHMNTALRGKDMIAQTAYDGELVDAAKEAFGALVGSSARDDSVQGKARIRLRKALGISSR